MFMKVINVPHHIDCTYKLCERGFPVLVFGISDIMLINRYKFIILQMVLVQRITLANLIINISN